MWHKFVRLECESCGDYFEVPVYCGDRFCEICSGSRRSRVRKRLDALVGCVRHVPSYSFKHLTLTIKNQRNLSVMVRVIFNSFKKLRQTSSWKEHVLGGAFVTEVTGSKGNWHVHLHIIIQAKYYEWTELLALWRKLSPGRGVFIQDIPKAQTVRYLTKYLTKCETSIYDRDELNHALKGTRLFQPFGTWYGFNKAYIPPAPVCKGCDEPSFHLYGEYFEMIDSFISREVITPSGG